jgi:hypothetical protein
VWQAPKSLGCAAPLEVAREARRAEGNAETYRLLGLDQAPHGARRALCDRAGASTLVDWPLRSYQEGSDDRSGPAARAATPPLAVVNLRAGQAAFLRALASRLSVSLDEVFCRVVDEHDDDRSP